MHLTALTLWTTEVAALADFYGRQLGLPVVAHSAEAVTLAVGAGRLTFAHSTTDVAPYHLAFSVAYAAVEAAADWLAGAAPLLPVNGARIAEFPNWLARSAYALDPAGNILEVIGRQAEIVRPPKGDFSATDVRGLSEIGLVVPDPAAFVAHLQATYGLSVFARQPASTQFAVVGDDSGLLIVVPPGRAWYPTAIASALGPVEVELTSLPGTAPVTLWLPAVPPIPGGA